jgi:hypothetical protein
MARRLPISYNPKYKPCANSKEPDSNTKHQKIVNADKTFIESLQAAKKEDGFANSVDKIKPVLPDSILLNGNNPLTLLNTALSTGIHAKTDEECLEIAQYIRVVLAKLSIRLTELLKDDKELKDAISSLNKFRNNS